MTCRMLACVAFSNGMRWSRCAAADLHVGFMSGADTVTMKLQRALKVMGEWIAYLALSAVILLLVFAD
jgi:hypothetical protein